METFGVTGHVTRNPARHGQSEGPALTTRPISAPPLTVKSPANVRARMWRRVPRPRGRDRLPRCLKAASTLRCSHSRAAQHRENGNIGVCWPP